jgi:hypothetical protein
MAKDASSADSRRALPPHDAQGSAPGAGNLTQELAQLLAASIAQNNRPGRRPGSNLPTGSEVSSLASLIPSGSQQRSHQPAFKDGLSALAYAPPAQLADDHDDDEPMPIPSTWREPTPTDDERWFRQQMGAAVLGLAAGLMVVVPSVLWLTNWLGTSQRPKPVAVVQATEPHVAVRPPEVKPVEVRSVKVQTLPVERPERAAAYVPEPTQPRPAETRRPAEAPPVAVVPAPIAVPAPVAVPVPPVPAPVAAMRPVDLAKQRGEEVVAQAERRIRNGDVAGAREMLAAEGGSHGQALFLHANTYDPEMLASWGERGRGAAADVAKARALYKRAADAGVKDAQKRLDALPEPMPRQ